MIIPTVKFVFDRHHRASSNAKGSVELRITFNRKQKFMSTGIRCYPGQWDDRNECIRSIDGYADNNNLLRIRKMALNIIGEMAESGNIDLNAIPDRMKQKDVNTSFTDYIYTRIRARKVSDATKKTYKTFLERLIDFGGIKTFSDITEKNIRDFNEYLHDYEWCELDKYGVEVKRKYTPASIEHLNKKMKVFINDAIIDGYISSNPYIAKRIKIEKGGTKIDEYLTREELDMIENSKMPTGSLNETRDLFVFQCLTGLAYSDLMDFDFTKVKLEGKYTIYTSKRMKTGVEFTFVLIPHALEILKKYNYHLPRISNQKYNVKLKLIADAAGLDKNITSHVGRRTAGSVWLNLGVPISVVSKCMGHRSIATTQKSYVKILDKTIVKAFEEHVIQDKQ